MPLRVSPLPQTGLVLLLHNENRPTARQWFNGKTYHLLKRGISDVPLLDNESAASGRGLTKALAGNILSSSCVPALCRLCLNQARGVFVYYMDPSG